MRNTFRYSLTADDYLTYEKFAVKLRKSNVFTIVMLMFVTAMAVYSAVRNGGLEIIHYVYYAAFVITIAVIGILTNFIMPKKKVNRYLKSDTSYLGENEITIDDKCIEIKNIPTEKETGMICIYPYGIMPVIYETEEYYYFLIGNEIKILPKRVIPQTMREAVYKAINSNPNRVYVK